MLDNIMVNPKKCETNYPSEPANKLSWEWGAGGGIRDLLFHYENILLFWFLLSVETHPALSVHPAVYQYMARANDVNNTGSQ